MIPWVQLDSAKTPDGGQELRLKQRGSEFSIMLGTNELMNSRLSGSEEALAKLSCDKIAGRSQPKILIGGLGMGFTLRAALAELGADARHHRRRTGAGGRRLGARPDGGGFRRLPRRSPCHIRETDVGHIIRSEHRRPGTPSCSMSTMAPKASSTRATTPSTALPASARRAPRSSPAACWRCGRKGRTAASRGG